MGWVGADAPDDGAACAGATLATGGDEAVVPAGPEGAVARPTAAAPMTAARTTAATAAIRAKLMVTVYPQAAAICRGLVWSMTSSARTRMQPGARGGASSASHSAIRRSVPRPAFMR